ncbi:macro domain-containing protein, partial [Candidatus Dojkabacteria bacterium]|nr:macro domain-containing protein [Candidatus Dojkabacteria bacterium]
AGLALECKYRYPEMNEKYKAICNQKKLNIGQLYLYKSSSRWILNFPTKDHWKFPSKLEYLEKGLEKFVTTYEEKGIKSIAFPMLGAQNGGLSEEESLELMENYLLKVTIPVEIYSFLPDSTDDIFPSLKLAFLNQDKSELKKVIGISTKQIEIILASIKSNSISNMIGLQKLRGVGEKAIEKCYKYATSENVNKIQTHLFNND